MTHEKHWLPYSDDPIKGISGQTFYKFDVEIDADRLDDEICKGLAQSNLSHLGLILGEKPPELEEGRPPFDENYQDLEPGMTNQESRRYRTFKREIDNPWAFMVTLKPNKFMTKEQDLYPWSNIIDRMPYTKEVIESLPFSEIGRAAIYGTWAGASVPCHRDEPSGKPRPHINFSPNHYRPVYVWDTVKKEKVYLPKDYKFYAYNVTDYHGVDPLPHFSYTVRVDGKYLKEIDE